MYYLAYGSNLSVDYMKYRCPDAVPIGTAELKDWRLVFRVHATIEREKGYKVPVVVWQISKHDEHNLDEYENYPIYYDKKFMPVTVSLFGSQKKRAVRAMVYVMQPCCAVTPPFKGYYEVISEGYERFRLNRDVLTKAFEESGGVFNE